MGQGSRRPRSADRPKTNEKKQNFSRLENDMRIARNQLRILTRNVLNSQSVNRLLGISSPPDFAHSASHLDLKIWI
jgi:hypothetical protein